MVALALGLAASLFVSAPAAPPRSEPPADTSRAAERDALRALAALAAGEPGVAEVQEAAARAADRQVSEAEGFARRARLAALLPRITAEVRRDERSYRVIGLQGAGEVDYGTSLPGRRWCSARPGIRGARRRARRARRRGRRG